MRTNTEIADSEIGEMVDAAAATIFFARKGLRIYLEEAKMSADIPERAQRGNLDIDMVSSFLFQTLTGLQRAREGDEYQAIRD